MKRDGVCGAGGSADGRLPERRLLNYKKLLAEAAHAKRREETARKKQLRSVERKRTP